LHNTRFNTITASDRNVAAPWKDLNLNKSIGHLKVVAEYVSDSMTKLQLVRHEFVSYFKAKIDVSQKLWMLTLQTL
jgi:hypothetical protein